MGRRGVGAKPLKLDAELPPWAWETRPELSRAERVVSFIEELKITSGVYAGKLFTLRDWQRDIIERIYATDERGKRPVREVLFTVPRKNGKTQLAAALALAHLAGPEAISRGQILSAGADRNQAKLIFRELEAFIQHDERLDNVMNVRRFHNEIENWRNGSIYRALSCDAKRAHGLSGSFIVCDELAQWKSGELYDALKTSTGAREEPLLVTISTQNSDPHHPMSQLTNYARQVKDGVAEDPSFLPVIFEASEGADWLDEAVWHAANPALGDFRSLQEMRESAKQAQRIPAREAVFRNLYLNQAVDTSERFIASADWRACAGSFSAEELRGRPCWAGLDLSSTKDLTSLALFFPEDDGKCIVYSWVPGDSIRQREEVDHVPYMQWQGAGWIEAHPGQAIDKRAIAFRLAEVQSTFDVQGIAFDRWRMADLKKVLDDEGVHGLRLVDWGQGYKDMGGAVDAFETHVLNQTMQHGNNPVLTWCVSNAIVEMDPAGARKISKKKSIEKVDALVALAMAVGLHAREKVKQPLSVAVVTF